MKKILFVIAVACFIASCKDKKDEKKVDDTMVTPTTTEPSALETTTTPATGVPSFSDPEVQKFANDYAAFIANYKAGFKDPSKMADLTKNMQDWSAKSQSIGMKLASKPEEAKKWADWVMAINKELIPSMQ
jgi:hypothetical protein